MDNFDELPVGGRSKVDWGDEVPVSGGSSKVDWGEEVPVSAGSSKVDEVPAEVTSKDPTGAFIHLYSYSLTYSLTYFILTR